MKNLKNLYQVELLVKYSHTHDWLPEIVNVVANGDAEKAVRKAKKYALGFEFAHAGKNCEAKQARLVTVKQLHQVDVP